MTHCKEQGKCNDAPKLIVCRTSTVLGFQHNKPFASFKLGYTNVCGLKLK